MERTLWGGCVMVVTHLVFAGRVVTGAAVLKGVAGAPVAIVIIVATVAAVTAVT